MYYRVLEDIRNDDGMVNEQSTKRKWDRGERSSTHKGYPPSWIERWKAGSTTAADFTEADLDCADGPRTQAALDAFLAAAGTRGVDAAVVWPADVQIAVGQIEDVFVYETPEEAWQYVLGGDNSITPEKLGMN